MWNKNISTLSRVVTRGSFLNSSRFISIHPDIGFIKTTIAEAKKIPNTFPLKEDFIRNYALKEDILINACNDAIACETREDRLAKQDANIPSHLPLLTKIQRACELRRRYTPQPAATGHPTYVLSEDIRKALNRIIKLIKQKQYVEAKKEILNIIHQSWLHEGIMTPQQEIHRDNALYLEMMEDWPAFNRNNIEKFIAAHGITNPTERDYVYQTLTNANKILYQKRGSWTFDIDGNKIKDIVSLFSIDKTLQMAIIDFFLRYVQSLLIKIPELKSIDYFLNRLKNEINRNINFEDPFKQGRAIEAQTNLINKLNDIIHIQPIPELIDLRDLVDVIGFTGHVKHYLRESSTNIETVFDDLFLLMSQSLPELNELLQANKNYRGEKIEAVLEKTQQFLAEKPSYKVLTTHEKEIFHQAMRYDGAFFEILVRKSKQFHANTERLLQILAFAARHHENFSCIISDTQDINSLIEVIQLTALAYYYVYGQLSVN
ncbi:MAG TPA: hypothetical protein VHD33_01565, partial [Legionellaceae bacterium]|nr:hypothetical protein [Legionellaceae bacterium]